MVIGIEHFEKFELFKNVPLEALIVLALQPEHELQVVVYALVVVLGFPVHELLHFVYGKASVTEALNRFFLLLGVDGINVDEGLTADLGCKQPVQRLSQRCNEVI